MYTIACEGPIWVGFGYGNQVIFPGHETEEMRADMFSSELDLLGDCSR